jgi:hypothetical protein
MVSLIYTVAALLIFLPFFIGEKNLLKDEYHILGQAVVQLVANTGTLLKLLYHAVEQRDWLPSVEVSGG